jgi:hypothetical protein
MLAESNSRGVREGGGAEVLKNREPIPPPVGFFGKK